MNEKRRYDWDEGDIVFIDEKLPPSPPTQPAPPPLPPINVNITMPPSNRVRKTVTTHRDVDGNLVAEVHEQDEE